MSILTRIGEIAGSTNGIPRASVLIADCGVVAEEDLEKMVEEERTRRILAPTDLYELEEDRDDTCWGEDLFKNPSDFLQAQDVWKAPDLNAPPNRPPVDFRRRK